MAHLFLGGTNFSPRAPTDWGAYEVHGVAKSDGLSLSYPSLYAHISGASREYCGGMVSPTGNVLWLTYASGGRADVWAVDALSGGPLLPYTSLPSDVRGMGTLGYGYDLPAFASASDGQWAVVEALGTGGSAIQKVSLDGTLSRVSVTGEILQLQVLPGDGVIAALVNSGPISVRLYNSSSLSFIRAISSSDVDAMFAFGTPAAPKMGYFRGGNPLTLYVHDVTSGADTTKSVPAIPFVSEVGAAREFFSSPTDDIGGVIVELNRRDESLCYVTADGGVSSLEPVRPPSAVYARLRVAAPLPGGGWVLVVGNPDNHAVFWVLYPDLSFAGARMDFDVAGYFVQRGGIVADVVPVPAGAAFWTAFLRSEEEVGGGGGSP